MKIIPHLDPDLVNFLKTIRGTDIKNQVPKILHFLENKCKYGVDLDKVTIKYVKKANYYGECLPKNYKSKKEGAERIVMSINTGVHQTTEQIFDTVCHAESLKVSKSTNTALHYTVYTTRSISSV